MAMTDPIPEAPPEPRVPAPPRRSWRDFAPRFEVRDWPAWIVVVLCAAAFAWQKTQANEGVQFAFFPAYLQGRWWSFVTAIFLHGGWVHIGSNMYSYLSIAPWVIARFGGGAKAVVPYHIFYLLCGIAGNVVFWLIHPHGTYPTLGASGAIYGVFAAMMRLNPRSHALYPVFSRQTLNAIWVFIVSNVIVIVLFGGPSMLMQIFSGQQLQIPIAWEAHLGGFIAGFFLIGLMAGKGWQQPWLGEQNPN